VRYELSFHIPEDCILRDGRENLRSYKSYIVFLAKNTFEIICTLILVGSKLNWTLCLIKYHATNAYDPKCKGLRITPPGPVSHRMRQKWNPVLWATLSQWDTNTLTCCSAWGLAGKAVAFAPSNVVNSGWSASLLGSPWKGMPQKVKMKLRLFPEDNNNWHAVKASQKTVFFRL
jgi:hypothetical protein